MSPVGAFSVFRLPVRLRYCFASSPTGQAPLGHGDTPGRLPERPKGADCKSAGNAYSGSNPLPATEPCTEASTRCGALLISRWGALPNLAPLTPEASCCHRERAAWEGALPWAFAKTDESCSASFRSSDTVPWFFARVPADAARSRARILSPVAITTSSSSWTRPPRWLRPSAPWSVLEATHLSSIGDTAIPELVATSTDQRGRVVHNPSCWVFASRAMFVEVRALDSMMVGTRCSATRAASPPLSPAPPRARRSGRPAPRPVVRRPSRRRAPGGPGGRCRPGR